jgi:hypothetical protein
MKRPCRTTKKAEDIRGYCKSKSRGNIKGEGIHGEQHSQARKVVEERSMYRT